MPVEAVRTLVERGELSYVAGSRYIHVANPARTARRLREAAVTAMLRGEAAKALFEPEHGRRQTKRPVFLSFAAHAAVALLVVLLSMDRTETAPVDNTVREQSHLVFLMTPGPGGGGGGGGLRQPKPAPKILRKTERPRPQLSVPPVKEAEPVVVAKQEPPPPEPAKEILAPVQTVAANETDRVGQIEHAVEAPDSNGPGSDGGVGEGQGTGNGEGLGSGIGEGEGGGIGGGPYRPGSGIEPPRLLREVKAQFTEEARRRGITGDVVLEIVVRSDGSVGTVHVLQGLGYGLEERAITAVRQWQFAPAIRKGAPVDVLVEVAVEFTLR